MLRTLKNISEDNFTIHYYLKSHLGGKSDILIICRNNRTVKSAIKSLAENHLGECEVKSDSILFDNGTRVIFRPVSKLDKLDGYRFKEYYFEEDYVL